MSALLLLMYCLSALAVSAVVVRSIWRSAFGVLLASTVAGFLIGDCLYPIFHFAGVIESQGEVADFVERNGEPGLAAALHVMLMSFGMLFGYIYRPRHSVSDQAMGWVTTRLMEGRDTVVWRASILLGLVSYLLYFYLVGVDVALINAAAARGGDFDGFDGKDSFVFLKTVASVGFVATCFLPMALYEKRKVFIVAFALLVATAYANSISRNLLLYTAIAPVLVYLRLRLDLVERSSLKGSLLLGLAVIPAALLVLTYGKVMGHFIRSYFTGDYYSMTEQIGEVNSLELILSNYGFQWVSVQAGIDHFFNNGGPLLSAEHALAVAFGAIPSRVLSAFGLDFLYYGNIQPSLTCINSQAFGYVDCTVPPLSPGYSAYLLPGAGGFIIGYAWMRLYGVIEKLWIAFQRSNRQRLWIPYFLWGLVVNIFTFIPATLAVAATQMVWVYLLTRVRARRLSRRRLAQGDGLYANPVVKLKA